MTKREIAALACKVLSLYAIIRGLGSIEVLATVFIFSSSFPAPSGGSVIPLRFALALAPFMLHAACAVSLWLFADGIAAAMVRDEYDQQPASTYTDIRATDLKAIAYSVVGLLILVQGTIGLSNSLIQFLLGVSLPTQSVLLSIPGRQNVVASMVSSIPQIIIGLWLLFGARRLAQVAGAVRDAVFQGPDGAPPSARDDV